MPKIKDPISPFEKKLIAIERDVRWKHGTIAAALYIVYVFIISSTMTDRGSFMGPSPYEMAPYFMAPLLAVVSMYIQIFQLPALLTVEEGILIGAVLIHIIIIYIMIFMIEAPKTKTRK